MLWFETKRQLETFHFAGIWITNVLEINVQYNWHVHLFSSSESLFEDAKALDLLEVLIRLSWKHTVAGNAHQWGTGFILDAALHH